MDDQRRFEYCFDQVKVDQGIYYVESNQDSNLNGKLIAQDGDGDWTIDCDWRVENGYRLVQLSPHVGSEGIYIATWERPVGGQPRQCLPGCEPRRIRQDT